MQRPGGNIQYFEEAFPSLMGEESEPGWVPTCPTGRYELASRSGHQYDHYVNNNVDNAGAFETQVQGCSSLSSDTYLHLRSFLFEN